MTMICKILSEIYFRMGNVTVYKPRIGSAIIKKTINKPRKRKKI